MLRRHLLTVMICSTLAIGCGGNSDNDGLPPSYVEARQKWANEENLNYHFTLRRSCFCLPEGPIVVVVRAGGVSSATFVDSGTAVGAQRLATLPTLSGLFTLVDAAYAQHAAIVNFTANADHGYLESLYIDYSANMADEEVGISVTKFALDAP